MRVEVMNKITVEKRSKIELHEDKVIISIYTPSNKPAIISDNPTIRDILFLSFEDCDNTDKERYPDSSVFSYNQAFLIFHFVMKWWNKVDSIWVQCEGGISRSAGVAAAILKALTNDDSQIFNNKKYCPNMLVYRKTLEAFIDQFSYPD